MEIIFFAADNTLRRDRLMEMLAGVGTQVRAFNRLPALARRLSRSLYDIGVVLVLAETDAELERILTLRRPLLRVPLVLVVPDFRATTTAKAHLLRPRYLHSLTHELSLLQPILERLYQQAPACQKIVQKLPPL